MIVSKSKKFIFIHIFKTGGSTITELLSPYIDSQFRSKFAQEDGLGWQLSWHLKKGQHDKFSECLLVLDNLNIDISDYFLVTFVRNPYSWILSVWNNFYSNPDGHYAGNGITFQEKTIAKLRDIYRRIVKKKKHQTKHFYELFSDGSFKNFILFLDIIDREGTPQDKSHWGAYDQYSFIENTRQIKFDFIGKFENFNTDVQKLLNQLDLEIPVNLPHRTASDNQVDRQDYLKYYDEESIAIVNRLFKRDFEIFNYQPIQLSKSSNNLHSQLD